MSIIYNGCNCPATYFEGINPEFADMQIEAVIGADQIQTLAFMPNYINSIYKQDCGNYEVIYSPVYPFFSFSKNGSTDEKGRAYHDRGTLTAGTVDDIGQYPVTMTF